MGYDHDMYYEATAAKEALQSAIDANTDNSKKKKFEGAGSDGLVKVTADSASKVVKKVIPHCKPPGKINTMSWGPNAGDTRMAICDQDGACFVWDTVKATPTRMYGCISKFAQCVALSPDENNPAMLVGSMHNAAKLYKKQADSSIMKEAKTWALHDGYISSLHFLEGGKKYISSSGDADIRVFDIGAAATDCVSVMRGHDKDCSSIKFPMGDPAKQTFITCSSDKTVKLWDMRSASCVQTFVTDSELNSCCITPDGKLIGCGGERDKTYLFDTRCYKMVGKYARNNQKTASCAFSMSGRELYVGHDDGSIVVWDIFGSGENKNYAKKIEAHLVKFSDGTPDITSSRVNALETGPAGFLASAGFDGKVKIWGAPGGA